MDETAVKIREKLSKSLNPERLEIENDSAKHAGHAGDDGSGRTHYSLTVVSRAFDGKSKIERHRMIYTLLADEMAAGVHALAIKALVPGEPGCDNFPQK